MFIKHIKGTSLQSGSLTQKIVIVLHKKYHILANNNT